MAVGPRLPRKTHFLGAKLRSLRKASGLTLEDLSVRCSQVDPRHAPSISYLSLIETGRRTPSERLVRLLADLFQRDPGWFLDQNVPDEPLPGSPAEGGIRGMPLEPGFLFSRELLERAIPELLAQTGTSGRQFAHVLIRSYQERHRNRFPDLERAAEAVGGKRFPLSVDDLLELAKRHGLRVRWFDRAPFATRDDAGREVRTLFRSFFEPPGTVFLNRRLRAEPARLKYDLAGHLGHAVLHGGDGLKSIHATGGELGGSPRPDRHEPEAMRQEDVLFAWRDFECSFFAGALLCPRTPFRGFLDREGYDVHAGAKVELTPAVILRRMTAVCPYRHWHYFDAYAPGYLRAVYRGNGIPLPWGNLRQATHPCRQWAVFRMLESPASRAPLAQLSLLRDEHPPRLYSCISMRSRDGAGNSHVLSVGVDLMPALESREEGAAAIAAAMAESCGAAGGSAPPTRPVRDAVVAIGKVLNIDWIADGLANPGHVICPRAADCPRTPPCPGRPESRRRVSWLSEIRDEILSPGR